MEDRVIDRAKRTKYDAKRFAGVDQNWAIKKKGELVTFNNNKENDLIQRTQAAYLECDLVEDSITNFPV